MTRTSVGGWDAAVNEKVEKDNWFDKSVLEDQVFVMLREKGDVRFFIVNTDQTAICFLDNQQIVPLKGKLDYKAYDKAVRKVARHYPERKWPGYKRRFLSTHCHCAVFTSGGQNYLSLKTYGQNSNEIERDFNELLLKNNKIKPNHNVKEALSSVYPEHSIIANLKRPSTIGEYVEAQKKVEEALKDNPFEFGFDSGLTPENIRMVEQSAAYAPKYKDLVKSPNKELAEKERTTNTRTATHTQTPTHTRTSIKTPEMER